MEDEKIKAVNQWPKPKLVKDIQIFLGFANFYWQFIQDFSCIAAPLTSMLKTIESIESIKNSKEIKGKAGGNSIISGGEVTNQINPTRRKKQAKTTKSRNLVKSKNLDFFLNSRNKEVGTDFFTPKARLAFTQLR